MNGKHGAMSQKAAIFMLASMRTSNLYLVSVLQDVAAFSDDNFEVKDWINKTFKSAEAQENRDVCAIYQFRTLLVDISQGRKTDKIEHLIYYDCCCCCRHHHHFILTVKFEILKVQLVH
jgi:hypothetical protein